MSAGTQTIVACPRDGAELVEVERNGVTIDACPTCRGIWLDRGELEKLIAQETKPAEDDDFLAEVQGRRASGGDVEDEETSSSGGRKRKRGGFLDNFMDFGGE